MPPSRSEKTVTLRSTRLEAKIDPRTFGVQVTDRANGQAWKMSDEPFDEVVVERDGVVSKETLAGAGDAVTRRLGEGGVLFEFPGLRLGLLLMLEENRLTFELIPREENERFRIKGVVYPRPFVLEKSSSDFLLVPFDQGLMIPANWPESIGAYGDLYQFGDERRMRTAGDLFDVDVNWWSSFRPTYAPAFENNMLMPWWAAGKKKGAVLMVLDEASWADSYLQVKHPAGGPTSWRLMWLPSKGGLRYPRRVVCHFMKGGYVQLAKAYRKIAADRGKIVTLAEKRRRLPQMTKLIGAPFLRIGFLRHSSQRYEHEIMMTFRDAAQRIEAFAKETGMRKLHVHARSWQQRGHDIQYPDLVPPAPDAGGPVAFDELATRVQKLGYAFGLGGDNYHDVAMDSPLFDESMLLRYANGKTNRRNMWASGLTSLICTKVALKYLRRNFEVGRTDYPATRGLLETAHPDSYWIGNYVSGYECYDERHPMTRNTCWDAQREIFQYIVDKKLLLNNEHPKDWACPYFYSARTRQVSQPVYGFNLRGVGAVAKPAPLWSLVFRDCCIPGGDSALLAMMNGAPPHVRLDDVDNPALIQRVKLHAKLQGAVMFDEMTNHELLSDDSAVQRSTFSSGATVTIDQDRHTVKIEGVKGIEEGEIEVVER
jgi:hypothetical protein